MKEEELIFIISQPRAGSTFLQSLLSNNVRTNTVSEPWVMLALAPLFRPELVRHATYDHRLAMKAFIDYQGKMGLVSIQERVKTMALEMYAPLAEGFDFVIDKTPRYWELLDDLIAMFPKAKIIILKRNPVDVMRSMIQTWEIPTLDKLNELRRDILIAPKVLSDFCIVQKTNPNVHELRYEDLLSDTNGMTKALYEWMGIEFSKDVLDVSKNTKHLGRYGDPYQNKKSKNSAGLKKEFQNLIQGYINWLDDDIAAEYGIDKSQSKSNAAFKYFVSLPEGRLGSSSKDLKEELKLSLWRKML